jgi:hypothetical protein
VEVQLHRFLPRALDAGGGHLQAPNYNVHTYHLYGTVLMPSLHEEYMHYGAHLETRSVFIGGKLFLTELAEEIKKKDIQYNFSIRFTVLNETETPYSCYAVHTFPNLYSQRSTLVFRTHAKIGELSFYFLGRVILALTCLLRKSRKYI